jgi:hypothetical protein
MKLANKIAKLNEMEEQLGQRSTLLSQLLKAFPDADSGKLWARTGTISKKQHGFLQGLHRRDQNRFKQTAAKIFNIN